MCSGGLVHFQYIWVLVIAGHEAHLVLSPSRCRPQEKAPLLQQIHPQSLMHEGLMAHFHLDGSGLCSRA